MKKHITTAIAVTSAVLLIGTSVGTVEAAASNKKQKSQGTVPVYKQPVTIQPSIQQLMNQEYARKLQPGEIRVMYVNHKPSNPDDEVNFSYMPYRYASISETAQKMLSLTGRTLEEPGEFPEGFVFQGAVIDPYIPFYLGDEYNKLRDQLKQEAQSLGQKVIAKSYKWTGGTATLTYNRGAERIRFSSGPARVLPPGVTLASLPGDKDEELIINGREVTYTVFGPHHYDLKAELSWSSKDGSLDYKLDINKSSNLTKEELETTVAGVIK